MINIINKKFLNNNEEENIYNNIYIPAEYRNGVLKHILLNYAGKINGYEWPLYLAIQGNKGEGKTFMLEKLCEFYNIQCDFISGSNLCGQNEGDSVKNIKKKYESTCIEMVTSQKIHLLVIDDFHLSIAANLGRNVSSTTNSQVLISYLMNLADNPYIHNVRVPIILIGNNFTNIYSALIRNGRMNFFKWFPTINDKINIVYYMFKKFYPSINYDDISNLVQKYKNQYIAFFQQVLYQLFFNEFDSVINEFHLKRGNILINDVTGLIEKKLKNTKKINTELLLEYAKIQEENKAQRFD